MLKQKLSLSYLCFPTFQWVNNHGILFRLVLDNIELLYRLNPYSSSAYAHKCFWSILHLPMIKGHPHSTASKMALISECSLEDFPIRYTFDLQNALYPNNLHKPPLICSLKPFQIVQCQDYYKIEQIIVFRSDEK